MYQKIYDFCYRLFRIAGRTLIKYSSDPRPASSPYVTGDGFRKLAQFIYDGTINNVVPDRVKEKDIIFVGDSKIKKFLREIHPLIKNRYVLITHNGDEAIDEEALELAGDKVIKWYGINVVVNNSKVIPLPLGIENKHYYVNGIPLWFNRIRSKESTSRLNRIFYGFTPGTNFTERQPALDVLKKLSVAETFKTWMNFKQYLDLLATYKFVASPPGSSVEGHRTWDALYIGIVPIVKQSITTDYFKSIGVPVWVVADWHELNDYDESKLIAKFQEVRSGVDESILFMYYWSDKIKGIKD